MLKSYFYYLQVKNLLKEIVASVHPFITEETPKKIMMLTRHLQHLTSSELNELVMRYCSLSERVSDIQKIRFVRDLAK